MNKEKRKEIKEKIIELLEMDNSDWIHLIIYVPKYLGVPISIDDVFWVDISPEVVRPAKEYLRKVMQILNGRKTPKGLNRDDTLIFWDCPYAVDTFLDILNREGFILSHWYEKVN